MESDIFFCCCRISSAGTGDGAEVSPTAGGKGGEIASAGQDGLLQELRTVHE